MKFLPLRRPSDERHALRLRPHMPPRCLVEQFLQYVWTHRLMIYVSAVSTVTLLVLLFAPTR